MATFELSVKNHNTFANSRLNELTQDMEASILAVGAMAERTKILIAKHLHTIDAEKLADEDFQNTIEYCESVLGMSKANAYAYIQVGRAIHTETVPLIDGNGNEFNFTQLRALCAVKSIKALNEAIDSGEISTEMTGKELEEKAREMNPKRKTAVRKEKRFIWDYVGEEDPTTDMSKTEILASLAEQGCEVLGEIKTDSGFYICAISGSGYPVIVHQGEEVKKVVEGEKGEA